MQGVSEWVNYLKAKKLPVGVQVALALQSSTKDKRTKVPQLSKIIFQDPVALFYVMSAFGKLKVKAPKDKEIFTDLDQVVSIMGFFRLEELSKSFEVVESHFFQKNPYYGMLLQASMHAAFQAKEWSEYKASARSQLMFISALLHDCSAWFIAYHQPAVIEKIIETLKTSKNSLFEIEKEILGCSLEEISYQLALQWDLPEIVTDCIDPEKADKLALISFRSEGNADDIATQIKQRDLRNQETIAAKTAAKIAKVILYKGWKIAVLQEYLDKTIIYLNLDQEYTLKLIRKSAVTASREYHLPGVLTPAADLLFISNDVQLENPDQSIKDLNILVNGKLALQSPNNKTSYHDLIELALKTINQGIGLERAVAVLSSSDKKLLVVRHSQGVLANDYLKDVVLRADEPHLFTFLMKASKPIWVDSHNYKEFENLIPRDLKDLNIIKYFFAVPVTIKNKSIGFILCDRHSDPNAPLNQEHYNAFKEVVVALTEGLKILVESKGAPNAKT